MHDLEWFQTPVILLPLRLLHPSHVKLHKDAKQYYSWYASRRMQMMIDRFEDFLVEYPVCVISVAVV